MDSETIIASKDVLRDVEDGPGVKRLTSLWNLMTAPFQILGFLLMALFFLVIIGFVKLYRFVCRCSISNDNVSNVSELKTKYEKTAFWYNVADWYWERGYQKLRPILIGDLEGDVIEAGVGTGHNLKFYDAKKIRSVTAFDLSPNMLKVAQETQTRDAQDLSVSFCEGDATALDREKFHDGSFDHYVSTFMYCVLPNELQEAAIAEMIRILKPGGRFRILEMRYSKYFLNWIPQIMFQPWVTFMYGARFDRATLEIVNNRKELKITNLKFVTADTYIVIEGVKK